ncbi:hypothetical protein SAMN02787118_12120 [Streptomyces mirabilis]|jgi:hypothetical protein|uniref:Uncharacterized protein n=1 Tax=Streptomyces mirabilis TaxID=68239 RepID=A0A1I2S666_9ACTN|nr:hypothetical protein SAMN02787118_12120 [Streptomyces mirabilis]
MDVHCGMRLRWRHRSPKPKRPPASPTGAAAQSNNDQGAEGVHKADIATAAELGKRVVEVARVYAAGRTALAA